VSWFPLPFVLCVVTATSCATGHATASKRASAAIPSYATSGAGAGVYTLAQAERGEATYGRQCAFCHGRRLEGDEEFCTPPLVGAEFWRRWRGLSVGALYDRMKKTMPVNKEGSLADAEYAEIVSFILRANELPAGQTELPIDLAALQRIAIANRTTKP
jgi:mono/diheme cytochrome c family protein